MIIVTGAAGFIGSNMVGKLNNAGHTDIILVDEFRSDKKKRNFSDKDFSGTIDRESLSEWLEKGHQQVSFIYHLGARTDTTEFDKKIFDHLNLNYSKKIWGLCAKYEIPLVYASSAATYGLGELGYKDDHDIVENLKPLNPYGDSKNEFDKWVLKQDHEPPFWAGIKFFNVFGPNEYHKGRMASVILHAFMQVQKTGKMKLFRSHDPNYKDGEQQRDFIYVKDVVEVLYYMMKNQVPSGIYNLGTGVARTFLDLVKAVFASMDKDEAIEFIDTPEDIRDKYQYYTCADMEKLKNTAGYTREFFTLEKAVEDYVKKYLLSS